MPPPLLTDSETIRVPPLIREDPAVAQNDLRKKARNIYNMTITVNLNRRKQYNSPKPNGRQRWLNCPPDRPKMAIYFLKCHNVLVAPVKVSLEKSNARAKCLPAIEEAAVLDSVHKSPMGERKLPASHYTEKEPAPSRCYSNLPVANRNNLGRETN